MRNGKHVVAVALMSLAWSAAASEAPPNYVGLLGNYVLSDDVRRSDDGPGAMLLFGTYLTDNLSAEFSIFGHEFSREFLPEGDDGFVGGGLDLRYRFGGDRLGGFIIGGLGAVHEDYVEDSESSPYANLGIGMLVGITPSLAMRAEARTYATFNKVSFADETSQYDTRLGLGFQYSFGRAPAPLLDSDGDGVLDTVDLCPGTPLGTPVDERGCPLPPPVAAPGDSDRDAVPDNIDQCPATPLGVVVDAIGCPADEDGDGVFNAADACPRTPPGFQVDATGCVVERQTVTVLQSVSFEFDSASLTAEARRTLDRVGAGLRGQPGMQVEIAGHTDALGNEGYNQKLSLARAAAVRDFLLNLEVGGGRMQVQGYGESRPVADNDTDEGRARNRRVEFTVLSR